MDMKVEELLAEFGFESQPLYFRFKDVFSYKAG